MSICKDCRKFGSVAQWNKEHDEWEKKGENLFGKAWEKWDLEEPPCPCDYCSLNNFGYS